MNFFASINYKVKLPDSSDLLQFNNYLGKHDFPLEYHPLLRSIFGNSSHLSQILLKNHDFFLNIMENGFDETFATIIDDIKSFSPTNISVLKSHLRISKQKAALLIAIADLTEYWELTQITYHLSIFAEICLQKTLDFLAQEAIKKGEIASFEGVYILAMGKLGAYELNYSSDIDLIAFYDPERLEYLGSKNQLQFAIKLIRDLVEVMEERTKEGYVFRVDLRLRPDPASTPICISTVAAMAYYETVGQNWERAAMIKARFIAGDRHAAMEFLNFISYFIWRKYLDFAAIEDIKSIKRQIESKSPNQLDEIYGYNLKTGHGGIREIEFFAVTQQLIWGGKEKSLRISATCDAINKLAELRKIDKKTAREMIECYHHLRKIEHRLQMIADHQTHSLPDNDEKMRHIAIFSGFSNIDEFIFFIVNILIMVKHNYSKLFVRSAPLSALGGNLSFTGTINDQETIGNIAAMGYKEPALISEIIRGWHHGRKKCTGNKRARELITELTPDLLHIFVSSINPDKAFVKFDDFLTKLPSGIQLFSLFAANRNLLELIATIMGSYPYLADILSRKPRLLEYVLSTEFLEPILNMEEELDKELQNYTDYQDILDQCRIFTHERQFQVGIQLIKKIISPHKARKDLSEIANIVLKKLLYHTYMEFASKHGYIDGGEFAIIALGKLGSHEMGFRSDIDLIFVYDYQSDNCSDGFAPLSANEYYNRLSRRFVTAFSALTPEGKLYDIDTRLRPSGRDGPVASNFDAFCIYYQNSAWIFEYMALTNAYIISHNNKLQEKLQQVILDSINREWDPRIVAENITDLRHKIRLSYPEKNRFDIKYIEGGLLDAEFLIQYLHLIHAKEIYHNNQAIANNPFELLEMLGFKEISHLYQIMLDFQMIRRLIATKQDDIEQIIEQPEIKNIIADFLGEPDFESVEQKLSHARKVINLWLSKVG